jgi:hypothetical protein
MRPVYLLPFTGLLFFLVTSCDKSNPSMDGTRLSKSIFTDSDGVLNTHFLYNQDDQLVRIQYINTPYNANETNEALMLEYNNAGKLIASYYTTSGADYYDRQQYTYNQQGDTIRALLIPSRGSANYSNRLVILDNNGKVVTDSLRSATRDFVSFSAYTYDGAGNVLTEKYGSKENGISGVTTERSNSYDSHLNPFRALGLPYYLAASDPRAFNIRNIQSYTENGTLYTWHRTYNGNSMPLESILPINVPVASEVKQQLYYWR